MNRAARWFSQVVLGARLSIGGGWVRTALTAVGVGLGVAVLLVSTSIPTMLHERSVRGDARGFDQYGAPERPATDTTLLVGEAVTYFRDTPIRGFLLQPDGAHPPVPPGLTAIPRPGEVVLSPALADLLASPEGALLRPRLDYRVTGTIGGEGLTGPYELAFYLGSDQLAAGQSLVVRIDHFGSDSGPGEGLPPILTLLVLVIVVALLLPVGMFVAAAVRFGGEQRDRRLAAIRLVGADTAMAHRIAAGEALVGAVGGLGLGAAFFLLGRQLIERLTLLDISVFAADVRPSPALTIIIVAGVPVAAVALTLVVLRRVIVEPLGVVRWAGAGRRRLWWRLVLPVVGLVLLYPLFGSIGKATGEFNEYQVVGGVLLLLVGVAALLPWLVQAVVTRLGGGSVSWQLAVRRLQLDSSSSVRAVTGIAVAAAGSIALQMLFAAVDNAYVSNTGQDTGRAQIVTTLSIRDSTVGVDRGLRSAPGVVGVASYQTAHATLAGGRAVPLTIGTCADLAQLATVDHCADGDVFVLSAPPEGSGRPTVDPGATVWLGEGPTADLPQWTVPATARRLETRPDPTGYRASGVYVTPTGAAAMPVTAGLLRSIITIDPTVPDAVEHVRNAAAAIDPMMSVLVLQTTIVDAKFADIRRGLFIGAIVILLLIGASLLVSVLEQLRDRRRLLAALVAVGTRRFTLGWSVLWQTLVPIGLGLALATVTGVALGGVLLTLVNLPLQLDWTVLAGITGGAVAVVILVTLASLPALWRLMRPDGLRTE